MFHGGSLISTVFLWIRDLIESPSLFRPTKTCRCGFVTAIFYDSSKDFSFDVEMWNEITAER